MASVALYVNRLVVHAELLASRQYRLLVLYDALLELLEAIVSVIITAHEL